MKEKETGKTCHILFSEIMRAGLVLKFYLEKQSQGGSEGSDNNASIDPLPGVCSGGRCCCIAVLFNHTDENL